MGFLGSWSGELGLEPDAFWRQTPRTYLAIVDGYRRRLQTDQEGRAWAAWTTAALGRVKKFPKLKDLMPRKRRRKRRTWQEILQAVQAWHADLDRLKKQQEQR